MMKTPQIAKLEAEISQLREKLAEEQQEKERLNTILQKKDEKGEVPSLVRYVSGE